MHYFNLALAALGAIASAAPAPAAPAGDFEILTCTAGSIKVVVVTYSNTALIATSQDSHELMHVQVSDPAYTKYGVAAQSVPLNGCASVSANFNAYTGQASARGAPKSSKKCTISGAPKTVNAELRITASAPFYQLVNTGGVSVAYA